MSGPTPGWRRHRRRAPGRHFPPLSRLGRCVTQTEPLAGPETISTSPTYGDRLREEGRRRRTPSSRGPRSRRGRSASGETAGVGAGVASRAVAFAGAGPRRRFGFGGGSGTTTSAAADVVCFRRGRAMSPAGEVRDELARARRAAKARVSPARIPTTVSPRHRDRASRCPRGARTSRAFTKSHVARVRLRPPATMRERFSRRRSVISSLF